MSILYTADGNAVETNRPEVHWPLDFMRMLAIFARNCEDGRLGIFCDQCKEPLRGANANTDNFWQMECQCRRYIGRNPTPTGQRRPH